MRPIYLAAILVILAGLDTGLNDGAAMAWIVREAVAFGMGLEREIQWMLKRIGL